MIDLVLNYINEKINTNLGYYKNSFGLCEIITKDESKFPAYYKNNEYKKVIDFDKQNSTIYYSIIGNINTSVLDDELPMYLQEKNYPIRLISVIKKNTFKNCNNNQYIDDFISDNISQTIIGSYGQLAKANLVDSIYVDIDSISLNRDDILSNELNIKDLKFPYEWSIVTIDLNVVISQYKKCNTTLTC